MNRKSLLLFIFVSSAATVALGVGLVVGNLFGEFHGPVGAAVGGIVGAIVGAEIAFRRGLVEAAWDRILWVMPTVGFEIAGLLASLSDLSYILIALSAVIGSGLGSLIAKYSMRFFMEDPPPSIL